MSARYLYRVELIHKVFDWDASFTFSARNARDARMFALAKLAMPGAWIVTRARRVK